MKSILKTIIVIIAFGVLEVFFYFLIQPKHLGLFFILWAILHLIFLLSNFSDNRRNGSYIGVGRFNSFGDVCRYDMHESAMNQTTFKTDKNRCKSHKWGIRDPLNIINLLFIIINGIGFIVYK